MVPEWLFKGAICLIMVFLSLEGSDSKLQPEELPPRRCEELAKENINRKLYFQCKLAKNSKFAYEKLNMKNNSTFSPSLNSNTYLNVNQVSTRKKRNSNNLQWFIYGDTENLPTIPPTSSPMNTGRNNAKLTKEDSNSLIINKIPSSHIDTLLRLDNNQRGMLRSDDHLKGMDAELNPVSVGLLPEKYLKALEEASKKRKTHPWPPGWFEMTVKKPVITNEKLAHAYKFNLDTWSSPFRDTPPSLKHKQTLIQSVLSEKQNLLTNNSMLDFIIRSIKNTSESVSNQMDSNSINTRYKHTPILTPYIASRFNFKEPVNVSISSFDHNVATKPTHYGSNSDKFYTTSIPDTTPTVLYNEDEMISIDNGDLEETFTTDSLKSFSGEFINNVESIVDEYINLNIQPFLEVETTTQYTSEPVSIKEGLSSISESKESFPNIENPLPFFEPNIHQELITMSQNNKKEIKKIMELTESMLLEYVKQSFIQLSAYYSLIDLSEASKLADFLTMEMMKNSSQISLVANEVVNRNNPGMLKSFFERITQQMLVGYHKNKGVYPNTFVLHKILNQLYSANINSPSSKVNTKTVREWVLNILESNSELNNALENSFSVLEKNISRNEYIPENIYDFVQSANERDKSNASPITVQTSVLPMNSVTLPPYSSVVSNDISSTDLEFHVLPVIETISSMSQIVSITKLNTNSLESKVSTLTEIVGEHDGTTFIKPHSKTNHELLTTFFEVEKENYSPASVQFSPFTTSQSVIGHSSVVNIVPKDHKISITNLEKHELHKPPLLLDVTQVSPTELKTFLLVTTKGIQDSSIFSSSALFGKQSFTTYKMTTIPTYHNSLTSIVSMSIEPSSRLEVADLTSQYVAEVVPSDVAAVLKDIHDIKNKNKDIQVKEKNVEFKLFLLNLLLVSVFKNPMTNMASLWIRKNLFGEQTDNVSKQNPDIKYETILSTSNSQYDQQPAIDMINNTVHALKNVLSPSDGSINSEESSIELMQTLSNRYDIATMLDNSQTIVKDIRTQNTSNDVRHKITMLDKEITEIKNMLKNHDTMKPNSKNDQFIGNNNPQPLTSSFDTIPELESSIANDMANFNPHEHLKNTPLLTPSIYMKTSKTELRNLLHSSTTTFSSTSTSSGSIEAIMQDIVGGAVPNDSHLQSLIRALSKNKISEKFFTNQNILPIVKKPLTLNRHVVGVSGTGHTSKTKTVILYQDLISSSVPFVVHESFSYYKYRPGSSVHSLPIITQYTRPTEYIVTGYLNNQIPTYHEIAPASKKINMLTPKSQDYNRNKSEDFSYPYYNPSIDLASKSFLKNDHLSSVQDLISFDKQLEVGVKSCEDVGFQTKSNFVNPSYPLPDRTANSCKYRLYIKDPSVCQIRVDLINTWMMKPTQGICRDQVLSVLGMVKNPSLNAFCGKNQDQHFYVHLHDSMMGLQRWVDFSVNTKKSNSLYRFSFWITQINCKIDEELEAPPGCLQYFPKAQGVIKSFNFEGDQYFNDMNYKICIKKHENICELQLEAKNEDFSLQKLNSRFVPQDRAGVGSRSCVRDFLFLPGIVANDRDDNFGERFCGAKFSNVHGDAFHRPVRTKPTRDLFIIFVRTGTPTTYNSITHGPGFRLSYSQNKVCHHRSRTSWKDGFWEH